MDPLRGYPITTPYGARGSHWSCDENSGGQGVHTGADFAAPLGTPVYAPIPGQIRHRSYGSAFGSHQFAISPDPGQPYPDGEVFFAHTRTRLADGVYVQAGDWIAEVGEEGNATGPHLHMELHPSSKGAWSCDVHADPQPAIDWQPADPEGTPPESEGMSVGFGLATWYSGKKDDAKKVYPDGDWHDLCPEMPPTGITAKSSEHHFLYARTELPDPRSATRTIETRWVRSDGDATAYQGPAWTEGAKDSIGMPALHFESGSGLGGQWQVKVTGGTDPVVFTTRYAKTHIYYELSADDISKRLTGIPADWLRLALLLLVIVAVAAVFT